MTDMEYALEWYRYGLEKGDDSIVKFMMHWIAFNWLYSEYRNNDERANIRAFCKDHYDKLSRYNPFTTGAYFVFEDGPVRDETRGEIKRVMTLYDNLTKKTGEVRVESLLQTIYQVRCNLFHGSKSLHNPRDLELVRSSAIIMEGYLKALLVNGGAS